MKLNYFNFDILGNNLIYFLPLIIWSLAWKGAALWKAAQRKSKFWFILILILNTFGVLEILYYFIFSEWKKDLNNNEEDLNKEN